MTRLLPLLLLALTGCDFMHDHFAIPDHRYKGTVILHVIPKGQKKSNDRSPSLVNGDGLKFNFIFQEVATQNDSSIQKLYGLSDSFEHHEKWSPRIGFRVRQDSTIDIFAYWHMDVDTVQISVNNGPKFKKATKKGFGQVWMANIGLNEKDSNDDFLFRYAAVEIEKEFYEFRFGDKIVKAHGRTKDWLWGLKYRLFPYYEDNEGNGAPGRIAVAIEEI